MKLLQQKTGLMALAFFISVCGIVHTEVIVNPNGSFESSTITVGGDTSSVEGWTFSKGGDAQASFQIVEEPVKAGQRALAITIDAVGSDAWSVEATNAVIPVVPGESYRYTVWVKVSEAGGTAHFTVGNPSYVESFRTHETGTLDENWKLVAGEFTIPSDDVAEARAPIHFSFEANIGKIIYIDSLTITQITGLTGGTAEGTPPIVIEAESGDVGGEFDFLEDSGVEYISIITDTQESTGASNYPGEYRTATYDVTFPDTGTYDLFARIRVGSGTYDDDSFFYGKGFGEKDPSTASDWILVNGMAAAGFAELNAIVRDVGGLGSNVWKWVNLSRNIYQGGESAQFVVESQDALTQVFSLGARETGLDIDKIAFGISEQYYTVQNLDSLENGSITDPSIVQPVLEPIAKGKDKFLGCAYGPSDAVRFTEYWNQITPGNAGKWGSVEGTRDVMNWTSMDEIYQLAKENDFLIRYHILVWGNQQPEWIETLPVEEQREEIEEWFAAVAERYPDLDFVEVVNEPLHDPPNQDDDGGGNYIEALGGEGETGWDWVITAFELARQYFPGKKLYLNEYGIVSSTASANQYVKIINLLKERDLIDGVGVQAHAFSTTVSAALMKQCLDIVAATGLPMQVMEMDVDGPTDEEQLSEYQRIFPVFWKHPSVEGVTLWGWKPGLWRNEEKAYLVNSTGEERPALQWLRAYVDTAQTTISAVPVLRASGTPTEFRVYDNYPNPFNPSTVILFDVPAVSKVSLEVFDIKGRHVETLMNETKQPGRYSVSFRANHLPSGVYLYRITAGQYSEVKQMLFVK